jgi:hypothetical protein
VKDKPEWQFTGWSHNDTTGKDWSQLTKQFTDTFSRCVYDSL